MHMTDTIRIPDATTDLIDVMFDKFVAAAHDGCRPYQWQRRLLHNVIEHGRWPDRLDAPTGAGKTMAIDIHVFLNALAGLSLVEDEELYEALAGLNLNGLPRRLVMTVNRRSLVDDQYEHACELSQKINDSGVISGTNNPSILSSVRRGLAFRESPNGDGHGVYGCRVLRVTRLRGGEPVDGRTREWRYHPTECQVICATPDMFGSRLLFHGYGTSSAARPIEAGLLAYDSVLIADEAHLSRQLVVTAKSVTRLEGLCESPIAQSVPVLQVVSTTATQEGISEDDVRVGVEGPDFAMDTALRNRMCKAKPVRLLSCEGNDTAFVDMLVEQCMNAIKVEETKEKEQRGVVGCIVNTVKTATDVLKKLRDSYRSQYGASDKRQTKSCEFDNDPIRGFVGPMRQYDKNQLIHGDVFSAIKGDSGTISLTGLRCVVATQTMEVGVDADFASLVTELPSGNALVQRAGRVNRRGYRERGDITVVCREDDAKARGPYRVEDLVEAKKWVQKMSETQEGLSAWACSQNPPKPAAATRMLWQRPEIWDIENLSHTDEALSCDVELANQGRADLDLWLRDDLDVTADPNIGLVVRELPDNDEDAIELLRDVQPVADESFPLRFGDIDDVGDGSPRVFIVRTARFGTAMSVSRWIGDGKLKEVLRPGDMLVVDTTAKLFDSDMHVVSKKSGKCEKDVYNRCQTQGVVISVKPDSTKDDSESDALYAAISAMREYEEEIGTAVESNDLPSDASDKTSGTMLDERRLSLVETYKAHVLPAIRKIIQDDDQQSRQAAERFDDIENLVFSVYPSVEDPDSEAAWLSLRLSSALDDGRELQELSVSDKHEPVKLNTSEGHQQSVECRAERFLSSLALPEGIGLDVRTAARHHDDGKKDFRFQNLLYVCSRQTPGYRRTPSEYSDDTYLAKSAARFPKLEKRIRREMNLQGWRHEQRSVAECWALGSELHANDLELVARLVGTSHGHGRSCFQDDADTLIPPRERQRQDMRYPAIADVYESARRLFDEGIWERIVEKTDIRYGYWGMAYMEAILRSADVTVSKEGN